MALMTFKREGETRVAVLKDKDGKEITRDLTCSPIWHMQHIACKRHHVIWGPLCRALKRKPKGKENVALVCKTCGNFMEYVKM